MKQQPIIFFSNTTSIPRCFLAVSQVSSVFIILLSFDHYPFYCLVVSHQDCKAVAASILWNDLLFKQPSNDISDREIRLQSVSGFSEIKSLIDGRKDGKLSLPQ